MRTDLKPIAPHSITPDGKIILPGYEWISFESLTAALKWRKRNYKLKTAYDYDLAVSLMDITGYSGHEHAGVPAS